MNTVNRCFENTINARRKRQPQAQRGVRSRLTLLAVCCALLLPGAAMAKKPVKNPPATTSAGCVVFAPAYIDTGYPFTLKIVRDPAYPGNWSQPMVDAAAVFANRTGGKITVTYSEDSSRYGYGVSYVMATLLAPSCNGSPCAINTSVDAVITASVREPLSDGSFRETGCAPTTASVNPAM